MVQNEICRCCGSQSDFLLEGVVIETSIKYFECPKCYFVQTESPFWLDKAYNSVINLSDTGIMSRNINNSRIVLCTLFFLR